jgi:hypothetical protein
VRWHKAAGAARSRSACGQVSGGRSSARHGPRPRLPAGRAGQDRAGRRRGATQHADRPAGRGDAQHGPQVAQAVLHPRVGGPAGPARPGRPRVFAAAVVAEVKAIACELPATRGVPISRWSLAELGAEVIASGLAAELSTSTVRRWLDQDAIKPWQHRSWVFPRDPDFAARPPGCWTCTLGWSRARRWARARTSSRPMRRPPSRRAGAATRPCHPAGPGSWGSSTSTTVAARWPSWPPGMSSGRGCSAAASPPLGSSRSAAWSPRS